MAGRMGARTRVAILAGGSATRLGGEKASVELGGRPLIAYPLDAARAAGLDPFVVGKRGTTLPEVGCEVVIEPDAPVHPLLGIVTALVSCGGPVVAIGCDMPFVTAPLLRWLGEREAPAVSMVGGHLEPLLAIYRPGDAAVLEAALAEQAPMREAVARLEPERVGEAELARFGDPHRLAMSVNTEADLEEAARALSG